MKIIAVGMNYAQHNKELGHTQVNTEPVIFMKPDSAILKDGKPFFIPDFSKEIHYETELVVRINRLGKNIAPRFANRYYDRTAVPVPASGLDSGETGSSDPNRPSKIANAIIKTPHTSRDRGPTAFHHSRAALRRHPYARTAPTRAYADVAHVLNQSRYA